MLERALEPAEDLRRRFEQSPRLWVVELLGIPAEMGDELVDLSEYVLDVRSGVGCG